MQLSLQKSLEQVDEASLDLLEESNGKLVIAVGFRAASPFNALPYTIEQNYKRYLI